MTNNRSVAHDEALEALNAAENIATQIEQVSRRRATGSLDEDTARRVLWSLNAQLGRHLKAADVHASLAMAEEIAGLRDDLGAIPNGHLEPMPAAVMDRTLATVHAIPGREAHDPDDMRCATCDSPAVDGPPDSAGAFHCRLHGSSSL